MTALAAAGYYSNNARNEGQGKQTIEDILAFLKELAGGSAEQALTLATDDITPAANAAKLIVVDTEAAAATDDLKHIVQTNTVDGAMLWLHTAADARNVVVKHAAGGDGQIMLTDSADLPLDVTTSWLVLKREGTLWREIFRWYGNDKVQARAFLVSPRANVATAATLVLTNAPMFFNLTGTTGVNAVTMEDGRVAFGVAAAAATYTNGANLIVQGGTYTTAAGDILVFIGGPSSTVRLCIFKADGTPVVVATQAEQEAGTNLTKPVTPGRQHFHPGSAKAWVNFTGTGTVTRNAHYNVSSVTDNGTGDYTINFSTPFSSADYALSGAAQTDAGGADGNGNTTVSISRITSPTASACRIKTTSYAPSIVDAAIVTCIFFGDL